MPVVQHNPFATRFTRPGALAYRLAPGESIEGLCARLEASGWRGQIVGPHGTGKSTLLRSLAAELARRGRPALLVPIGPPDYRLGWLDGEALGASSLLAVDGYDRLGALARWRLGRLARRRRKGLVITAHRDMGLPALATTHVTLDQAVGVAQQLLEGHAVDPQQLETLVERLLERQGGNLREVLFELFDAYRDGGLQGAGPEETALRDAAAGRGEGAQDARPR